MQAPIILPELGGSPLWLSVWFAELGDRVFEGDRLVEVVMGGATFDVSAPATGYLVAKYAWPNDSLQVGQVLGTVDVEESS